MNQWSNWSGTESCQPAGLLFPRSEDDVCAIVASAAESGQTIRVAGSGHSHYRLVPTDGIVLDLSGLAGVIDVDAEAGRATVRGGTPIYALGRPLHDRGVGLANQGDIDRQAIAGATATGTHGTGTGLTNLSASVTAMSIVTATGELVRCSATERPAMFTAARLGLGAFGIVTALELEVVPAYRLKESGWDAGYDELRSSIRDLNDSHRHFEFFWFPANDTASAKFIDVTDEPAAYPVGEEGSRQAWSYEVLPNHRARLHTEMEFAVPVERALECLDAIRALMQADFPEVFWPVEYRRVAADDVWLSQAYERDVATISVHHGVGESDGQPSAEGFFRACEAIFVAHEGRPHWGKAHFLEADQLRAAHPKWDAWWSERNAADPSGMFLNDRLSTWRP